MVSHKTISIFTSKYRPQVSNSLEPYITRKSSIHDFELIKNLFPYVEIKEVTVVRESKDNKIYIECKFSSDQYSREFVFSKSNYLKKIREFKLKMMINE